jgi:hypothetical protein
MSDNISFVETEQVDEKTQIILRQTDYTLDVAREKLKLHNFDHMAVIRAYLGIAEKKAPTVKSLNQEIYTQLRHRLDGNMREYNARKENGGTKLG